MLLKLGVFLVAVGLVKLLVAFIFEGKRKREVRHEFRRKH